MSGDRTDELEREHEELFHELRSMIPGAEVLFAFLLTIAFSGRFADVTPLQERVYYATFLCSGVALILLLAPAAYHRVRFRQGDKENMLRIANKQALSATVLIVGAITGVVFLITDLLFEASWAAVASGAIAALAAGLWWGLPLVSRLRSGRGGER